MHSLWGYEHRPGADPPRNHGHPADAQIGTTTPILSEDALQVNSRIVVIAFGSGSLDAVATQTELTSSVKHAILAVTGMGQVCQQEGAPGHVCYAVGS
jgi:hypothetical protein